jgi:hypothetical protein
MAVTSKYSGCHFISEKYKRVQSFKVHFFQNSLIVQIYTPASHYKVIGNIPGSHFVKAFTAILTL